MTHSMHWKDNVCVPIIQCECDIFVKYWDSHKIRGQEKSEIPVGEPDHVFFPWANGSTNMGIVLDKDESRNVTEVSGNVDGDVFDFIPPRMKRQCVHPLSNPGRVQSKDAIEAFRFLKRNIK